MEDINPRSQIDPGAEQKRQHTPLGGEGVEARRWRLTNEDHE